MSKMKMIVFISMVLPLMNILWACTTTKDASPLQPARLSSSTEMRDLLGVVSYLITLDKSAAVATIQGTDSTGQVVFELVASKKGTSLRRYIYQKQARLIAEELVLDRDGKQLVSKISDSKRFGKWVSRFLKDVAPDSSEEKAAQQSTCTAEYLGCAEAGALLPIGNIIVEIGCMGALGVCLAEASSSSSGGSSGSSGSYTPPPPPECGGRGTCCELYPKTKKCMVCKPKKGSCP
jgi:hypothetical protein